MKPTTAKIIAPLLAVAALAMARPLPAQESSPSGGQTAGPASAVSPEAQAIVARMTAYLQGLKVYSIKAQATRDEVVALGYKLQHNEQSELIVQRPNKLRAEISGDVRNRTFVYDGTSLFMYSPDDAAFVKAGAARNLEGLIEMLLDIGADMPLIDVLYQGTAGTLTEAVRGGVLVGATQIDGIAVDHLAFRQANIDWQLWVEQGARPLPIKILITTRYEFGDPQFEAILHWDLTPKIHSSTFAFVPPKGAIEVPLAQLSGNEGGTP